MRCETELENLELELENYYIEAVFFAKADVSQNWVGTIIMGNSQAKLSWVAVLNSLTAVSKSFYKIIAISTSNQ